MRHLFAVVVMAAALGFSGCKGDPATPEFWSKAMKGAKRVADRVKVVEDLRASGNLNASMLPMLHEKLSTEKSSEVKASIARVLGEMKDAASLQPLLDGLDRGATDSAVNAMNREIVIALGQLGDARAAPALVQVLRFKDDYTKIEAINTLGLLRAQAAVEPLMALATEEDGKPFISKKAIQALGDIGDAKAVPALVQMMFRERRGISFYMESSYALYQVGAPSIEALLPILEGKNQELIDWAQNNNVKVDALYAKAAQVLGDLHDVRSEKALLEKLSYDSPFLDLKLVVRMRMADALGRMRSKDAVKPLSAMLSEEEANARAEYIRALVRIGSVEAVPALVKVASLGSYDAREPAVLGVAMLGDETHLATFDSLLQVEEKLTTAECKEYPEYGGCNDVVALVKKHQATLTGMRKRLDAAKDCKADVACWATKLNDSDAGVRERAAYELGRSGKAEYVDALTQKLTEKHLETRLAIIQAIDWLVHDNKEAATRAKNAIPALDKQLAEEKGKTEFVKVNEDLRRLAVKLKRSA
jgi:HEAT repeat protein